MIPGNQFNEDYFLRGVETGTSLYTDYRWMPELTVPMVRRMIDHLGIAKGDTVLDFGCARGYTVRAFQQLGYDAWGVDCSGWAVENCDKAVVGRVRHGMKPDRDYDWIIAKDVLEHIPYARNTVFDLMCDANKGIFAVVPLTMFDSPSNYVIPDYEKDKTHVQRHTLMTWVSMFLHHDWRVEAAYRVLGIKDNYFRPGWEKGNGFVTAHRIGE